MVYRFGSYRYHGNYCGPGWSDKKWQDSVEYGKKKPVDYLDYQCMLHDRAYARSKDPLWRKAADDAFYYNNINGNSKQRIAALLVKHGNMHGKRRSSDPYPSPRKTPKKRLGDAVHGRRRVKSMTEQEFKKLFPSHDDWYAAKYNDSGIQTSVQKKTNMGRRNAVYSSNLSGKVRATKKPTSIKYFKDVYETGGTIVGENVCYISHATFPLEKLLETACLAIARALAAKVGVVYNDASDTTVPFGGDLAVYWRVTPASQGTVNTSTITAPQTLTGAGGVIRTLLRTVLDITTDGSGYEVCNRPNAVIDRIELKPSLSSTSPVVNMPICLDLHACKIHAICYNSLKVQNQSDSNVSTDDDNAFQVDAVPLVGKVYYGKGSYAVPRHMIGSQLMPIQTSSVEDTGIAVGATFDNPPTSFATATADWQLEPPDGKMFINCSKEGKYSIEPGQMTTNTLKKSIHMSVSKMLYEYAQVSGNINKTSYKLQNYCMLAIEKAASIKPIRAVVAANEIPKINLLYQLDQALYVYVQVNKPQVPILQRYLRQADQNVAAVIPV